MKILVFSDTHLSLPFDEKQYHKLHSVISQADQVIINGDFWEGYLLGFEEFINSPWNKLFPLLKQKKTVYIYGNHDKEVLSDERRSLFSDIQTHQYTLTLAEKTYILEHGHRLMPRLDDKLKIIVPPRVLAKPFLNFERLFFKKYGLAYFRFMNSHNHRKVKKNIHKEFDNGEILVCGHSHYQDFDPKNRWINTGVFKYGVAQYLWIEENKITPMKERYDQ